jgi:hypothetical protein
MKWSVKFYGTLIAVMWVDWLLLVQLMVRVYIFTEYTASIMFAQ